MADDSKAANFFWFKIFDFAPTAMLKHLTVNQLEARYLACTNFAEELWAESTQRTENLEELCGNINQVVSFNLHEEEAKV